MTSSSKNQESYFYGHDHHAKWFCNRTKRVKDMSRSISTSIKELKLKKGEVSLVGTGMSGALSVPFISHNTQIPFALIRHSGERTICRNLYSLIGEVRSKVIFIDDLICSGRTLRRVLRVLKQHNIELVGAITLKPYRFDNFSISTKKEIPVWSPYSFVDYYHEF